MRKKQLKKNANKSSTDRSPTCSLCGQFYNNFVFKGGYICEDCLDSIKDLSTDEEKEDH
ncbi:MAG: hypothetical protein HFE75_01665 [Firmicutes bacterium]|jgi:hypothetical protein|nr:hypothetical protein [Bacillota bacterium]